MNRRHTHEHELIGQLQRAGRDVELDADRILDLVDGRIGQQPRPRRRRAWALRLPVRLLVVPLAASVAAAVVLAAQVVVGSGEHRIRIAGEHGPASPGLAGSAPASVPAPPPTSALGGGNSITSITSGTAGNGGSGGSGGSVGDAAGSGRTVTTAVPGVRIEVAPAAAGTAYQLPLGGSGKENLIVGSLQGGEQEHLPAGGSSVGPVQPMGSGHSVVPGPYRLGWGGPQSSAPTWSNVWLTAPQAVRGVPAGLRVPVRARGLPSRITLLTGTIQGAGELRVTLARPGGLPPLVAVAELPGCGAGSGSGCPTVVLITLDTSLQAAGTTEALVELAATSPGARVGLAAVELD